MIDDLFQLKTEVVPVELPGRGEPVYICAVPFSEWSALATEHAKLERGAGGPLIAKTVATVLCDAAGVRVASTAAAILALAQKLMAGDPKWLMILYKTAWTTVLKSTSDKVDDHEKNPQPDGTD
jgi:hypothetical protein